MSFKSSFLMCLLILSFITNSPATAATSSYNVRDYGAAADGRRFDTRAIQKAIDRCHADGGGTVEFPAGTYLSGTIVMKDNVILHVQAGGRILGSQNIRDYPKPALIWADGAKNIGITGFGVIDGQAKSFRGKKARPALLKFVRCTNVRVQGVTLQHPGAWTQHYLKCDGVTLRDLKIYAHGAENNDLVDINQSRNVVISGLIGDSDDDGITLKSTGPGLVENVVISDCIIRTRTNAIKAGTESYGGFRDITVANCTIAPSVAADGFSGRPEGLAGIALEIVDGGVMENVVISNIAIEETTAPIFIRLGNRARGYENLPGKPVGVLRNISISNVIARNAGKTGCSILGEIGRPVQNVTLSNIRISFKGGGTPEEAGAEKPELVNEYPECTRLGILPAYGFFIRHVDGLTFRDIELSFNSEEHRPAMMFNDVQNLKLLNVNAGVADDAPGTLVLRNTRDVFVNGCSPLPSNVFLRLERNCRDVNVAGNNLGDVVKPISVDETIDIDELNVSSNLTGKATLLEMLQPNIERDSLGMVHIYYPGKAEVYYTLDGETPIKSSLKYSGPFERTTPGVIKARAFESGLASGVAECTLDRLRVLPPRIFPVDRFFHAEIKVTITCHTKGAAIYYTTDGTPPDQTAERYREPIDIRGKTILRAAAFKDGLAPSEESVSKYEPVERLAGVQYKYYEGRWERLPNFLNLTPVRSGVVDAFSLDAVAPRELYFGLFMHAFLPVEKEGEYTFYVASNDGSTLLVDNELIVANDGAHGTIEKSGHVFLQKGVHLIKVRYFQAGGVKSLKVSWQGPGFEKTEIKANLWR